jgi:hypothetical protein
MLGPLPKNLFLISAKIPMFSHFPSNQLIICEFETCFALGTFAQQLSLHAVCAHFLAIIIISVYQLFGPGYTACVAMSSLFLWITITLLTLT